MAMYSNAAYFSLPDLTAGFSDAFEILRLILSFSDGRVTLQQSVPWAAGCSASSPSKREW